MKILAIDTTASPVSAALTDDGFLCGEFFLNIKTTHSQTLMPLVDALLKGTNTKLENIDLFAVNSGPGSFTGVRIGVSTIKGITMPLKKPCASVSTLEAMALQLPYREGIICSVMDARCSQVYNAMFRAGEDYPERITPDRAMSIELLGEELRNYSDNTVYLVGDGASVCYDALSARYENLCLVPINIRFQHAYGTAAAAQRLAEKGELCLSDELLPGYLRLPQAQRELLAKQKREREDTSKNDSSPDK